jgi:CheY-like chemotaxis protein
MDLQMPEINGYQTSQLIRSSGHPDANSVFILAMTADTLVDHYSCIQRGINHHITKPIDIDHFYSVLRAIKDKES